MKQIYLSLGRLAIITCASLAIGTMVAKKYHQTLLNSPDSILRNPPSLIAEGGFDSSRDETWFGIFFVGGLVTSVGTELILYRRRVHEIAKEKALFEADKLKQQLRKKEQEVSALITQKELILTELECLQQETQKNAQKLEDEIRQIRDKFEQNKHRYEQRLATEKQNKTQTEQKLQAQRDIISELQLRQQENIEFSAQLQAELAQAQYNLEELQQQLSEQTYYLSQLQQENLSKTLESNIEELQKEIHILQGELKDQEIDQQNQEDFLELLENLELLELENLELLENENKRLRECNDSLIQEKSDNISEIESLRSKYINCQQENKELKATEIIYQTQKTKKMDLSAKHLAFVGGEEKLRTKIIHNLRNDFNLGKVVQIPPLWECQTRLSDFKLKLQDAHIIFHFTCQTKHNSQNNLKRIKNNISGKIVPVNETGYNRCFKRILECLISQK